MERLCCVIVLCCSESKCPRGGVYVAASSEVEVEVDERGENPEELSTFFFDAGTLHFKPNLT